MSEPRHIHEILLCVMRDIDRRQQRPLAFDGTPRNQDHSRSPRHGTIIHKTGEDHRRKNHGT